MVTLEEYFGLWFFVFLGALTRLLYVFARKNHLGKLKFDWSKFKPEELAYSALASILTTGFVGIVNELLVTTVNSGIEPTKIIFWILFFFLGIAGNDGFHQITAIIDARKEGRVTTVSWKENKSD